MLFACGAARAQVSAEIELKSDDRYRGRSLSDGRPVIEAGIGIDSASGIYAGANVTAILTGEQRAGLERVDGYVGLVTRLGNRTSVDIGVAGYAFTERYSGNRADRFGEVYAGITTGNLAAYLRYAPNYLGRNVPVIYADVSTARRLGDSWTLKAHAGLLTQTSGPPGLGDRKQRYDTRIAVARPVFGMEAELAWTFAGPNDKYFDDPWSGRSAVTVSLTRHF